MMCRRLDHAFICALGSLIAAASPVFADTRTAAVVERLPDLPLPVAGGGLLALNDGRLVYAGGTTWRDGEKRWLTDAFIYEPGAARWDAAPPLPAPADASVPLSLRVDGRWILLGGETDDGVSSHAIALAEEGGRIRWDLMPNVPFRKAAAAGGVVEDTLVVVGGADDGNSYASGETTVWVGRRSDASREEWSWQRLNDFPGQAHSIAASAVFESRLYVFGGLYAVDGAPLNTDEAWSFSLHEGWRKRRPLPVACRGATAVAVEGVGIVIAGGWSDAGSSAGVLLYRPELDTYKTIGALPAPIAVASGIAIGRDVYLAGNEDKPRSRRPDFFRVRLLDVAHAEPVPSAAPRHAED